MALTVTAGGASTTAVAITTGTGTLDDLYIAAARAWTTSAAGGSIVKDTSNNLDYHCILAFTSGSPATQPSSDATHWAGGYTHTTGVPDIANSTAYNAAPIWKSGSNPYTYTVKSTASNGRQITIANTGTLNINNPGDVLEWDNVGNVSGTYALSVAAGGTINIIGANQASGEITLDFDKAYTYNRTSSINFSGHSTITGYSGHEIVLKHFNSIATTDASQAGHTRNWDYVKLEDNLNGTLTFASSGDAKLTGKSMTNIWFHCLTTPSGGSAKRGYVNFTGDMNNWTFSGWEFNNCLYSTNANSTGIKFSNSTFKNSSSTFSWYACGLAISRRAYNTSKTELVSGTSDQPFLVFDTCYFDNNSNGTIHLSSSYNSVTLMKNCTFGTTAVTTGLYAYYGGLILLDATTNTNIMASSAVTKKLWGTGTFLHIRTLTLTVKDENGNALQNAVVLVYQKELKERWVFATDANGQIKTVHGDDPVFVEKEETSLNTFTQWSNGTGSQIHRIVVSKPGYQTWSTDVAFTADKTITATLQPIARFRMFPTQY